MSSWRRGKSLNTRVASEGLVFHNGDMFRKTLALVLVSLYLSATSAMAQTDVIGLYLTWQRDPSTTMTVNWVSLYEGTPTNVWYRASGAEEWLLKTGTRHQVKPSVLQVRRVELTGLKGDTSYEFYLGEKAPKDSKGVEKFRTMPAKLERPVRFVTGGDMMHSREFVDAMNRQAGKLDPDFALLGGDLAYANGVDATRWIDWFQSWKQLVRGKGGRLIPMVVAIGNHEVKGGYNGKIPEEAPYFYGFFVPPQTHSYYALDFGKYLSFIVMDSGHTQPITGPQADWLGKTLAARTEQQFIFPIYHYPAYGTAKATKGKLPSDSPRAVEIRTNWIPHFERYGVSAVFENDHHNYKRTYPLRQHKRDEENGIVYLGDGAWGVNTRTVPSKEEGWYLAHAEPRRHLHHITLHPSGQIKAEAVDAEGKVFDQTTLERARTKPMP